jgi:hypothetical protein
MMKNHKNTVGALAAATAMLTGYAMAGEPTPAPVMEPAATTNDFFQGEIHVGYSSNYEFRFVDRGEHMVEVGLDGAFNLGNGWGINVGAWYAGLNDSTAWKGSAFTTPNELDMYLGIGKDFGVVDVEVGYIYYYFDDSVINTAGPVPGAGRLWTVLDDTQEVYAQVGVDLPWEMRFATTYYYDFDSASGWYWDFKVSKSFEFSDCLALKLAVGTAMADGHGLQRSSRNWVGTDDGYQGWYASAALPWQILDTVTLTPYVRYTDADSDLATSLVGLSSGKSMVIGGVSLSVSF